MIFQAFFAEPLFLIVTVLAVMKLDKRIMVDMSATLIHHGHVRLIGRAAVHGKVIVGLTSDAEIARTKGYAPELSFEERKEVLLALRNVSEVVETPWLIDESVLDRFEIDLLVHGSDNSNPVSKERLLVLPRTEGVSSSEMRERSVRSLIDVKNRRKRMFTPGPSCILPENILALTPVFGRGDAEYTEIEKQVLEGVRKLAGQDRVVRLQGSASLAIEMAVKNFIRGKVLVVSIGYYSQRLSNILKILDLPIEFDVVHYDRLAEVSGSYDWVMSVYTETSHAFRADASKLRELTDRMGAKLFFDATGSIGLEPHHECADLMAFSSCKGLFGLVGAGFISYNEGLEQFDTQSFYMNVSLHEQGGVTGPYHAITSLYKVLPQLDVFVGRVREAKQQFVSRHTKSLTVSEPHQPLLCTHIDGGFSPPKEEGISQVLYTPRSDQGGSVVCHLGVAYGGLISE